MGLLEVIAGVRSGARALALADAMGRADGQDGDPRDRRPGLHRQPLQPALRPGGVAPPAEQIADIPTIDRICRSAAAFAWDPSSSSDLVGVDTGFDVSRSFYELSFGEPRWRPSPIHARMVAAGLHGRKTGRGYYDYTGEGPHRPADPEPPARQRRRHRGCRGRSRMRCASAPPAPEWPRDQRQRARRHRRRRAVLCAPHWSSSRSPARPASAFAGLGLHTARVAPAPGGVLVRMVCQVINESAFALGEGVGSAGHRHRHDARHEPPARPARVG